ncbi:uncharacterized protein LOC121375901 [Gigantopelta aegis]|uniref:uncharacterized protein LOC121375901 n=1 Tax=Gigantopelta aegis TaxID=1735272 RepID=UPI001B8886CA|nr:uncharacterized protein LOC121375901 [Gigantopelta aegis]
MSVAKVLKNVFTFTQVLGQASSEEAALWDTQALENALKWAQYCEQVHQHVQGKPFESDFEDQLQEMTLLLDPPLCLSVDLALLGNATQVIQNVLLQNPHLNIQLVNGLVCSIRDNDSSGGVLIQRILELGSLHGAVKISEELMQDVSLRVGDIFQHDVCLTADSLSSYSQAVVLMQHLIIQLRSTSKLDRFTQHVERLAEALVVRKDGLEVLLCCLCVESSDPLERCQLDYRKTRDVIYQWMEKASKTSSHRRKFCEVSSLLLANVAVENDEFFQLYQNILLEWGERLVPDYTRQTDSTKLYGWRPRKESSVGTFSSLTNHFVTLLGCNQPQTLRQSTAEFLTDLAMKSYFNIWRDVIKTVQKTPGQKHCNMLEKV